MVQPSYLFNNEDAKLFCGSTKNSVYPFQGTHNFLVGSAFLPRFFSFRHDLQDSIRTKLREFLFFHVYKKNKKYYKNTFFSVPQIKGKSSFFTSKYILNK